MESFHVGNLNLSNTKDFQFFYGSQLYGTLFGVYVKFEAQPVNDDSYLIESMEFKTINYKGMIDLEIFDLDAPKIIVDETTGNPVYAFKMTMKALHQVPTDNRASGPGIKFMGFINENLGNADGWKVKKNEMMHVDRRLVKMHPGEVAYLNGIFDTEFYYRDGVLKNGEEYKIVEPKPKDPSGDVTSSIQHGGGICPESYMNIS